MNIRKAIDYIQSVLKIKTKKGKIVPFRLNEPQNKLYRVIKQEWQKGKPIRIIILKARQMGFSTLTEGIIFHRTATKDNVNSFIIAHTEEATNNLFNMSKLFYDCLPGPLQPERQASNSKELIFDIPTQKARSNPELEGLKSKIKCATAGGKGVGRSDTVLNLHASEVAFWGDNAKETLNGLMQAVPSTNNSMVIIESTANGFNYFKELWDKAVNGENDFVPVFFAWFELEEYKKPYDGFELTAEEKELQERFDLSLEQLSWRRWCIKNNCGGDIELFKQEYPSTPEEAFISTGACVFDKNNIIQRINDIRTVKPIKRGYFGYTNDGLQITDMEWVDDEKGYISVYEEPKENCPYVLGGDTAGDGSDYFTGHVIDNLTGVQSAVFWGKLDEDEYTRQIYCLGMYYNNALIGLEANFSTYPIRELERLGYTKQYVRETPDTYTHSIKKSFGYLTSSKTRPVMIAELVRIVREDIEMINDIKTLQEMLSFIRNDKGRPQAETGQHDDLVMGLAIAYQLYMSNQQSHELPGKGNRKVRWEPDQWEDYYNADTEQRRLLIAKWGDPF